MHDSVFSSSCSVYGAAGGMWLDEAGALNPVTPYGIAKMRAERVISRLADDDFSPTFLRSGTLYGLTPRIRFDLVVNNLVAWAVTSGGVLLKSDGTPWRPVVHVQDVARAFVAVLRAPRQLVHDEAFNVGRSEENYRIREIAEIVANVVSSCGMGFAEGAGPDVRSYRANCSKIARVLPDFRPEWTVRRGVVELCEAYQRVGLTLEEFEGNRFNRMEYLKSLLAAGRLEGDLRWRDNPCDSLLTAAG
ncbi:MAG: NAD(P)-dependent oxidoreductase [Rhodospirillales bacterium]|nr:NAD(P)-dependent oxidoreductase [Rhodospirillales bacterium]